MLNAKINKGEISIQASGNLPELMSDVTMLLGGLYDNVIEEQKEDFKYCLERLVKDELYSKTCKEIKEKADKEKEEVLKKLLDETPEDLLKMLKDIIK
jgi:hypothetical protein